MLNTDTHIYIQNINACRDDHWGGMSVLGLWAYLAIFLTLSLEFCNQSHPALTEFCNSQITKSLKVPSWGLISGSCCCISLSGGVPRHSHHIHNMPHQQQLTDLCQLALSLQLLVTLLIVYSNNYFRDWVTMDLFKPGGTTALTVWGIVHIMWWNEKFPGWVTETYGWAMACWPLLMVAP